MFSGIKNDIANMAQYYFICKELRAETLQAHELSERQWQIVATDLFHLFSIRIYWLWYNPVAEMIDCIYHFIIRFGPEFFSKL